MRKVMFILNPTASGFKNFDFKSEIENYIKSNTIDFEYSIKMSTMPKETMDIARKSVEEGYNELIAVGGDGTINEVGEVCIENHVKLGIIAAGTGNDYLRSFGVSDDFKSCMERIIRGKSEYYDFGRFANKIFINIASVGFDADVIKESNKVKKFIKNKIAYKLAIIRAFFKFKRRKYKLIIDDKVYEDDYFLIAIGCGQYYGGKIRVLPYADLKDGLLDICAIKYKSKFDIFKKIDTIFKSTHVNEDITSYYKAKSIKIISDNIDINYDGELIENFKEVEFITLNEKIEILI